MKPHEENPIPQYPIYIISKERWESPLTVKALERMQVPYHLVIEPQEYNEYASVVDPAKILTLPFANYNQGQGSIPARNWVWQHAQRSGARRHWILDDNLRRFCRLHRNTLIEVLCGAPFREVEVFVDRFQNVALAGHQYTMFGGRRRKHPRFSLNTRIYSSILIKNDLPFRWRGRYNEDTDLSIRALKAGWCTALWYQFQVDKKQTMTGGNTDTIYDHPDARLWMARSLRDQHPDVATVTWKWGRWQHSVDYRPFKQNRLILKPGADIPSAANNFEMVLQGAV